MGGCLRYFLAVAMLLTGSLILLLFREYSGPENIYVWLAFIGGLVLFWGGYYLERYDKKATAREASKRAKELVEAFKKDSKRLQIDLTRCEIKEHNYIQERDLYQTTDDPLLTNTYRDIQAWNVALGRSDSNTQAVQVNQCVLICHHLNSDSGQTEKFISSVIYKDKATLSFYIDFQKTTSIYVDKVDRRRYYFDLEFLDK